MTFSKVKTMFCLKTVYFFCKIFTSLINVINYFYNS